MEFKYQRIARALERQIRDGTRAIGTRLPSIRSICRTQRVSMATANQAYLQLERLGLIRPEPRSGYYVTQPAIQIPPAARRRISTPQPAAVGLERVVTDLQRGRTQRSPLVDASLDRALLPFRELSRALRAAVIAHPEACVSYAADETVIALRRQLVRRAIEMGCALSVDDFIVTSGATEALSLAIRAVAPTPGDLIAVESPCYYALLRALETLRLRAIEIPVDSAFGMDLDVLERVLRKHEVKACYTIPTGQNPTGCVTDESHRKRLAAIASRYGVAVIEDDVAGDLTLIGDRPRAVRAFDEEGWVMTCSSFSKTLSPGLRVGWIAPGKFTVAVERLKAATSGTTASLPQIAVAEFLEKGRYERYLRRLRTQLLDQLAALHRTVLGCFPEGTQVTLPRAGFVLWIELPRSIDSVQVYHRAAGADAAFLPGALFSPQGKFQNCMRLNGGNVWSERVDHAVRTLGRLLVARHSW